MRRFRSPTSIVLLAILVAFGVWLALSERSGRAGVVGLAAIEPAPVALRLEPVVGGLDRPTYLTHAGDGSGRLYLVERSGVVRILEGGELLDPPFLDLRSRVAGDVGERGLFSLAFHPGYAENGRLFVSYTARPDGRSIVAEVAASPDRRRTIAGQRTLFELPQPAPTHNGGQIAFGPDGYLYVGFGDGILLPERGSNPAQDLSSHYGTIARVEVDGWHPYSLPGDNPFVGREGVLLETWAYGLRNPWRFSFDRETGDLFVGDVGEARFEEINRIERGGNYGWHLREGGACRVQSVVGYVSCVLRTLVQNPRPPLAQIAHLNHDPSGGASVIGGYVYRGEAIPALQGTYLFGDFVSGRVWGLWNDGRWRIAELLDTGRAIVSFGEDEVGEVYVVDFEGEVLRVEVSDE